MLLCTLGGASFTPVWAATTTYQHVFNAKPSTGSNVTLSSVNWDISATNLGSYNSGNYAGVQVGTKSSAGSITLTSSSEWGGVAGTYKDKTKITEVRLWLNTGGTTVTPTVTIGGEAAISDGTTVVKNSSAGSDWTKTTKVTFTPASDGNSGTVVISVSSSAGPAFYICCMEIDCEEASAPITSISFDKSEATVDVGGTVTITPTISPAGYTETPVWASDDTSIATVSNGVVTGVAAGTALITLTSPTDASIYDVCEVTVNAPTTVATPTMSVAEGTYNVAQSVTLSCVTGGATIRYTTDGTDPTSSSNVYSSAISVGQTMTIKAKAFKDGLTDSDIASATYTLKCVAPTFSPDASTVSYGSEITLSSTTGSSTIYYTTNGDTPTTSSTPYDSSNKPSINASQTIKAIAAKSGWSNSDVSSAVYIANYTITGVSNDEDKGTVTASTTTTSNTTITATPKSGYRVIAGDGGYSVTSGSATVVNNGDNTFTVTPTTDCIVQINFEAIPTHTVTFFVNGDVSRTATVAEGASITFPTAADTPSDASEFNKTLADGKTFMGWYTAEYSHATDAPAYVNSANMGNADVTYYAVYATVIGGEEDASLTNSEVTTNFTATTMAYGSAKTYNDTSDGITWEIAGYTDAASRPWIQQKKDKTSYIKITAVGVITEIKVNITSASNSSGGINDISKHTAYSNYVYLESSPSDSPSGACGSSNTISSNIVTLTPTTSSSTLYVQVNSGARVWGIDVTYDSTTGSNFTTDNRSAAGIAFANSEMDVKLTSGYTGQALTNPNSLTVSYSSSDETVATINASTGAITELLKAGSTTITATFAGNATYKPAVVSYDLNVTEKTPHGLAYAVTEVEKLTTDAAFTNTLTNGNSLDVSYTSSATGVATVNSTTGEVTIKGAGSATITATFDGNEDYEAGSASYTLTVSKATPTLSFASENAIGRIGEAFAGNALTNPASLTVSYESSDETVATINESTGAITDILKAGTTTITASFDGDDTYVAGSASFTLKVLANPTITVTNQTVTYGTTFTVDDSAITGGDITVTSGNTSIATVSGLVITPVACGTVTITVSTAENDNYRDGQATFNLTINAPAGSDEAPSSEVIETIDFSNNGWGLPTTSSSLSGDYTKGVQTVTISGTGYYFGSKALLLGKSGAYVTLPAFSKPVTQIDVVGIEGASSSVVQNIYVGSTAVSTATTGATGTNEYKINSEYQAAGTIYTLKVTSAHNTQITKIVVHQYDDPSESVTLNTSGYATYCSVNPIDFSSTTGYTAWRVSNIASDGTITFTKITEKIKGGQGVLLYNKDANGEKTNATITFADGTTEFTASQNMLKGTTAATYLTQIVGDDTNFGLSGNEFKKVTDVVTVPVNKAYLPVPTSIVENLSSSVKAFTFVFEDFEDGVRTVKTVSPEEAAQIFDLSGRRLNKMQKGINIVNGRKVLK